MSVQDKIEGPVQGARPASDEANDAIRASYLSEEDLRATGSRLGSARSVDLPGFSPFDFALRQRDNEREILVAYRSTVAAADAGELITPAAEWLADNHYIVEKNIREVERDLPIRFYRQLPAIDVAGGGSIPSVMALAWLYVAHTHSTISLGSLGALVDGYQSAKTLRIGELWALPSILRFVLIENLRRISHRVERARKMRRGANEVADRLLKLEPGESAAAILAEIADTTEDNPFAAQLLYRLRDGSQTSKEALVWLEQRLEARGTDAEEVLVSEHNRLASGNVTIGNIIRSLRKIDDVDWAVWFEGMSEVDRALREATDFGTLDFASRDLYRKSIEKLAERSGKSEMEVARVAISMASSEGRQSRESDIGFYLVGNRRTDLEARIGYPPRIRERAKRRYERLGWLGIAGPVALSGVVILALVAWFLGSIGLSVLSIVVLLALFALPASEAASGLFNAVATLVLSPTRLIGYEYETGIPAESRTLVAIPCLIGSRDTVDELVRHLEVHYLATTHGEVYFALISDWPDSRNEETKSDSEIFRYARSEIDKLNARHDGEGGKRFFLLHRRRLYNASEGVWMGWERKRGKLHELNRLLRGDPDTTFLDDDGLPEGFQYVMTLDADTRLTRDAVTQLVGKLAHPTNEPVIDPATSTVVSGHGILQPRVTPSLTTGEEASAFQRIFSINRGLDPYVFTVSDVYQDLLGEGSFTGKGLYHIDAFEAVLKGRVGENEVLSHDLLEGTLARCGLATDVELVEDFPIRYDVEVSRQHRWARGDWQLLPFIFGLSGHVPMLGRWKMFDNLRRSSTPVAWLAASVLGWCLMPVGPAVIWQAILIFSLFVAPTMSLISGALPRRSDIVALAHLHTVLSEVNSANAQVALRIVFIGHTACVMADAILRTLYRMFVSRRHLLEWRTAAQAHSSGKGAIANNFRDMWEAPVVAVVALALAALSGRSGFFVAVPFVALWALSPAVAWFVSQSAETEDRLKLSARSGTRLRQYARRTWRFFEEFANAENNDIPPDNFQEDPVPLVAHRTSPTNIGVYLLSTVSARDFGWIGLAETIDRLEKTVATIDRMAKFRGHLFNWYDTRTLEPLMPRYVSAVDSGNLAGHLVCVSSACAEWAQTLSAHLDAGVDGIADTAGILSIELAALPDDRKTLRPLRRRIEERLNGFHSSVETLRKQPEFVSIRSINLTVLAREIHRLTVNLDHETQTGESASLVEWATALSKTCEAHVAELDGGSEGDRGIPGAAPGAARAYTQPRLRHGFRLPAPEGPQAPVDRLPRRRRRARRGVLRPVGLRGAPHEPLRHRQGRPADGALVPAGAAGGARRLAGGARVLVGLDVRIFDAAAGDGGAPGRAFEPVGRAGDPPADRLWAASRDAVGHFGIGFQRPRSRPELPVFELRRALARPEARARPERGHRAIRLAPGDAIRAGGGAPEPDEARKARCARPLRLPRCRRLHADPRSRRGDLRGGVQLHGAPPGHVDRGGGQRHLQRQAARALPFRSGDRGGGAAAAGKGAEGNPDPDGEARARGEQARRGEAAGPAGGPLDRRSAGLRPGDAAPVQRALFDHADGDGRRLFAMERPGGDPLDAGPRGRPVGQLRLPARHRIERVVVGDGGTATGTGRDGAGLLLRRQGGVPQEGRRHPQRARLHRRDGERCGGTPGHDLQRRRHGPFHRSDLLCRGGGRAGGGRRRPPGLFEDVREDRDRREAGRHIRRATEAQPLRSGHERGAPDGGRQRKRIGPGDAGGDGPPRLSRARAAPLGSGGLRRRRPPERQRRVYPRSGLRASPRGQGPGRQEGAASYSGRSPRRRAGRWRRPWSAIAMRRASSTRRRTRGRARRCSCAMSGSRRRRRRPSRCSPAT